MLLAIVLTSSAGAQEPTVHQAQEPLESTYISNSQIRTWKAERGDTTHAEAQLGGIHWCSEDVNARIESEFIKDEMLDSCRQETGGYDISDLLHPTDKFMMPSEEQMIKLCRSEACAVWLDQVVEASWLPECRYRQSQTSFRSLAQTLLRIRENWVDIDVESAIVTSNAKLFLDFYELIQLANLLNANKESVLNEMSLPVLQFARQLSEEENVTVMGFEDNLQPSAVAEPSEIISGTSVSGTWKSPSNAIGSTTPDSSTSLSSSTDTSNLNSTKDFSSASDRNSSDTTGGFTDSDAGPHASSTTTTTELTPSYAYVVGAWILFNGSYFFLMRRK
ncbi:unnamed protein product [Peronospora belbahrii]|uniref:Uncharacterized protein n=1 Tax=Peronospora belbahrii TaxID=622444 RepID=A0AAU9KQK5_9STRA|nr:unnamed protein product [Peronospora belbahrii]CAH0513280.1 unnamed protein product [Peronospora belbahrii]